MAQRDIKQAMQQDPHHEFKHLREYYDERLQLKLFNVDYHVACAAKEIERGGGTAGIADIKDIKTKLYKIQQQEKNVDISWLFTQRLAGEYSYNVLDSGDFQQAKKIERRIARYDRKRREKAEKAAHEQKKLSLKNIEAET